MEEEWSEYTSEINSDFFKSKEALFKINERVSRGKAAYKGLSLTNRNNSDIRWIYRVSWEGKADLGQSLGTYIQFCVVAGQYARFAIPVDLCAIDDLSF